MKTASTETAPEMTVPGSASSVLASWSYKPTLAIPPDATNLPPRTMSESEPFFQKAPARTWAVESEGRADGRVAFIIEGARGSSVERELSNPRTSLTIERAIKRLDLAGAVVLATEGGNEEEERAGSSW